MNNLWKPEHAGQLAIADKRIVVDVREEEVYIDGKPMKLIRKRFGVLALLAQNRDVCVTYQTLTQKVWECDYSKRLNDRINVTVKQLRGDLGNELGHRHRGAVRNSHMMGYYAVSHLGTSKAPTQSV